MANFDTVKDALSEIDALLAKADEQANVRRGAIEAMNRMADALQAACDLVSKEISGAVLDFHQITRWLMSSHSRLVQRVGQRCPSTNSLVLSFAAPTA
ncbi:MAG: hypothetical protein ACT4P3_03210 [Betaproteobacteria bacterium]